MVTQWKGVAAWGGTEGHIQVWDFGESSDTPHPPTATPLPTSIPTSTPTPLPSTWFFNNTNQFTTTHTFTGHTDFVYDVAWSPNGLKLASASADKTIRLWDTTKGQPLQKLEGHTDIIMTVAWSPDGSRLASGGYDKTIRMWDVANAQPLKTLTGHPSPVVSVAWSPDGSQLASAGWDDTVRAWDIANGQELWALTVPINERSYIAWSPNGSHLAIITGGGDTPTIQVLDSAGRNEMDLLTGWANMLGVWAPDSARLAWVSRDNVIRVKDITNGQELRTIEGGAPSPYVAITNLAWSLDGSQLAAVYQQGLIRVWDISSGVELREFKKEVIAPYADFGFAIHGRQPGHNWLSLIMKQSRFGKVFRVINNLTSTGLLPLVNSK